jgi:arylsulfatase A-like enzyme
MAVGFRKPHLPFVAPKKYWDLYNRADMPLATFTEHAKDAPEVAYHKSGELRNYIDIPAFATFNQPGNHVYLKEEKQKELIHGYYAAVSYMDAQVGILLNTLDSLGLTKNTIIVLWGDHGWHLGDHSLWHKHTNFEQATRAPLIISAAGQTKGYVYNGQTEHVDVFPTLCELSGLTIPNGLDGVSLAKTTRGDKKAVKEYSISQWPKNLNKGENAIMGYTIRTERYRYTEWVGKDFRTTKHFNKEDITDAELYDYKIDPNETHKRSGKQNSIF